MTTLLSKRQHIGQAQSGPHVAVFPQAARHHWRPGIPRVCAWEELLLSETAPVLVLIPEEGETREAGRNRGKGRKGERGEGKGREGKGRDEEKGEEGRGGGGGGGGEERE